MLLAMLAALEGMKPICHGNFRSRFARGTGILAILAFVVVVMTIAIYLLLTHWEY